MIYARPPFPTDLYTKFGTVAHQLDGWLWSRPGATATLPMLGELIHRIPKRRFHE